MRLPSGEKSGSRSSAEWRVIWTGWPVGNGCTQISRPSPPRSDAYASSEPDGATAGSIVKPASAVIFTISGASAKGAGPGRTTSHVTLPAIAAITMPTTAIVDHGVRDGDVDGRTSKDGFAVDTGLRTRIERDGSAVHTFTVSQVVGGWSKPVDVHVAPTAFRNSSRPGLPVGGRLAAVIARRALATHLWRDGMLPESGVLHLDTIGSDEVAEALREDVTGQTIPVSEE